MLQGIRQYYLERVIRQDFRQLFVDYFPLRHSVTVEEVLCEANFLRHRAGEIIFYAEEKIRVVEIIVHGDVYTKFRKNPYIYKMGDILGKVECIYGQRIFQDLVAKTECYTLRMKNDDYERYFYPIFKQCPRLRQLIKFPEIKNLREASITYINSQINTETLSFGQKLFSFDEQSNYCVFFIIEGEIELIGRKPIKYKSKVSPLMFHKDNQTPHYKRYRVAKIGKGEIIGTTELISENGQLKNYEARVVAELKFYRVSLELLILAFHKEKIASANMKQYQMKLNYRQARYRSCFSQIDNHQKSNTIDHNQFRQSNALSINDPINDKVVKLIKRMGRRATSHNPNLKISIAMVKASNSNYSIPLNSRLQKILYPSTTSQPSTRRKRQRAWQSSYGKRKSCVRVRVYKPSISQMKETMMRHSCTIFKKEYKKTQM